MSFSGMKPPMHIACAFLCCASMFATTARASVVVSNTRVVYPADARDVTVRLTNHRATPVLVEAWIEPGDAAPDAAGPVAAAPFAITPPLLRMEPGKGQALRVHRLPAPLAEDRETLFWLNILDLPADPPDAIVANVLKMAVRSRIKLFARPAGLPGTANRAPERTAWRLLEGAAGVRAALRIDNPTPYHVTIARVVVGDGALDLRGGMVAPFGHLVLPLDAPTVDGGQADASRRVQLLRQSGKVAFRFLNDSGGAVLRTARLASGAHDGGI